MTATAPVVAPEVSRLVRSVEQVLACADGNGSRAAAVQEMVDAAVPLLRHADTDPVARELDYYLRDVRDGTATDEDPATKVAWLALSLGGAPSTSADEPDSFVDRLRARLMTASQVKAIPPPRYLLDGIIVERSLGMIHAKRASYKSITALDWAASIATGTWWQHRRVQQGPVLYVLAEGTSGMGKRVRAWEQHHRVPLDTFPLFFYPTRINFLSTPEVIALCTVAAELKPVLIILDTLSRSIPGGDENGSRDMSTLIEHMTMLQEVTGAAIWVVHHDNREGTSRGHSSIEGAMDTVVECKGAERRLTITVEKQKDDPEIPPLRLHVVQVELPEVDEDGRPITSIVLHDRPDPNHPVDDLTGKAADVLRALELVALDDGVTATVWSDSATGLNVSRSQFYEHKKTLIVRGLVRQIGEGRGSRFAVVPGEEGPTDDF